MHVHTGYQKESDKNLNIFLGEKQFCDGVIAFIFKLFFSFFNNVESTLYSSDFIRVDLSALKMKKGKRIIRFD